MDVLRRLTSSVFESACPSSSDTNTNSERNERHQKSGSYASFETQRDEKASNLGLTFLTDQLLAMGVPVKAPTDISKNRVNADDLADFLERYHKNHYLILNLDPLEESFSSEELHETTSLNSVVEIFNSQMLEISWERDLILAHSPSFERMFQICFCLHAWLSMDPNNIALLQCHNGKARSGIVAACYFLYIGMYSNSVEAFSTFYRKRWDMKSFTDNDIMQRTPHSVLKYIKNFHDLVRTRVIPNKNPLNLKGIIVRDLACKMEPQIQIYDDYKLIDCSGNSAYTSHISTSHWDVEQGLLTIIWEHGLDLDAGFSIICYIDDNTSKQPESSTAKASCQPLFRYMDSTWFLSPSPLKITKSELDIMKQHEYAVVNENFRIDLLFRESKNEQREYIRIDYTGQDALRQGILEITKHHMVLPNPSMHSNFIKMGFEDLPIIFALQVSNNAPNIALDILHSTAISKLFTMRPKTIPPMSASLNESSYIKSDVTCAYEGIQSRREISRHGASHCTRSSTLSTICCLCQEDDFMCRPQLITCTGVCKRHYHTNCAKIKRIPFGLTTPSDRANHAAYIKKFFISWACDGCQEQERSSFAQNTNASSVHRYVDARSAGDNTSSPINFHHSIMDSDADYGSDTKAIIENENFCDDINGAQKIKEFLESNGMSVDDLLRAAQPAVQVAQDATLSDYEGSITDPLTSIAGSNHHSPSSSGSHVNDWSIATNSDPATDSETHLQVGAIRRSFSKISESDLLDRDTASRASMTKEAEAKVDVEPYTIKKDDDLELTSSANTVPTLTKYELMLKRGVPFNAVQNCMKRDGLDPSVLQPIQQGSLLNHDDTETHRNVQPVELDVALEKYQKYHKMLRFGCPKEAVKQKIIMDGLDLKIFESQIEAAKFLKSSKPSKQNEKADVPAKSTGCISDKYGNEIRSSTLKDESDTGSRSESKSTNLEQTIKTPEHLPKMTPESDNTISKYLKMLKIGLTKEVVQHKMKADGIDPALLDPKPTQIKSNSVLHEKNEYSKTLLKDHEKFSKYFNMLKVGLPEGAVRQKMLSDGVDPQILELGPNAKLSDLKESRERTKLHETQKSRAPNRPKRLHLQPISDSRLSGINQQTIWEEEEEHVLDFDMDMDELESLFFNSNDQTVRKKEPPKSKPLVRKKKISLIDGKRAMNAGISLARVKRSNEELADGIRRLDVSVLTLEQLTSIREILPTRDELQTVLSYKGEKALLGDVERFILTISTVRRFERKMDILIYIASFPILAKELEGSLKNIANACDEVKGSRLLKILLAMVLKLGNTLNGSGEGEEIRGFTVDSLLRLGHTRAVNQKTTVLHYLVRLVKKNHPPVLDFHEEISCVPLASRESFDAMTSDYNKLAAGTRILEAELQAVELEHDDCSASKEAAQVLRDSLILVRKTLQSLESTNEAAKVHVASVLEYFGEDPRKNATAFFTTLSSFCSAFQAAKKEVLSADEAAQREERMKLRRSMTTRFKQSNVASPTSAKAKSSYSRRTSSLTTRSGHDR